MPQKRHIYPSSNRIRSRVHSRQRSDNRSRCALSSRRHARKGGTAGRERRRLTEGFFAFDPFEIFSRTHEPEPMKTILSYGMGVESSALILKWVERESLRDFDLTADLIVI